MDLSINEINYVHYDLYRYYRFRNLNEKSEIYSYGVVLLELITGLPAVIKGNPSIHILEFLRSQLEKGDLNTIIDPRLQGKFDVNSGWKVLRLGISCTASTSIQRPSMSVVLAELKQCATLESPILVPPRDIYSELSSSELIHYFEQARLRLFGGPV
jgi:hypothetical protein